MHEAKSDRIWGKNRETKMMIGDLNIALSESGYNNLREELANVIYQVGQIDFYRTVHSRAAKYMLFKNA